MLKIKIEFELKENGKRESFETTLKESPKATDFLTFVNKVDGEEYVVMWCALSIWKPIRNILCGERVDVNKLTISIEESIEEE